jgi:Icc protein
MKQTPPAATRGSRAATRDGGLRVLQITDTHLYADPGRALLGVNTLESLRQVLDLVRREAGQFDLVLATGDLVHDASAAGYARFISEISGLGAPVYCLPGNHDERVAMAEHLRGDHIQPERVVDSGNWRIVLLDSTIPEQDGGRLSSAELERLDRALRDDPRPTLVCLHHQPVPVGSAWIDTMALANAADFFGVIDAHTQVRGVLWGHVHQDFETRRGAVRLLASPSTCVQFLPGAEHFQVDPQPPGCRLLTLTRDGEIQSEVLRLASAPHGLELASAGY